MSEAYAARLSARSSAGQPARVEGRRPVLGDVRVGLGRRGGLLAHAGVVAQRELGDRVDGAAAVAPAEREERARSGAGADEDVRRPGRAVHEVPGRKAPLLTLDEHDGLALDDEEVLLVGLAVVPAGGLTG